MKKFNIQELIMENICFWPPILQYGLCILFILLIGVSNYHLIAKPNLNQKKILFNEENSLRKNFEKKQHESNLINYKKNFKKIKIKYSEILQQLINKKETSILLDKISQIGVNSGLGFDLFAPQSEQKIDFYTELAINISVKGEYQQLALFLSHIAEIKQLISWHSINIYSINNASESIKNEQLKNLLHMDLTMKIYFIDKDENESKNN